MLKRLKALLDLYRHYREAERKQMLSRSLYVENETPRALGTKITWKK